MPLFAALLRPLGGWREQILGRDPGDAAEAFDQMRARHLHAVTREIPETRIGRCCGVASEKARFEAFVALALETAEQGHARPGQRIRQSRRAVDQERGARVAFQILGKTSDQVDIGDGNSLSIARKLQGYLIASAAESVSTDTNNVTTITYGFAGTSKVAAKYQSGLTKEANDKRLDSSTAINLLTEVLKNRGVVAQPTASPSPSATATATATATPTATATATATP